MTRTRIRGGAVGTIAQLKNSLKRSGSNFMTRVPADGTLTVRFLTEPEEWISFYEHYDQVKKFYPCTDVDCPGCLDGDQPSARYLANALDIGEGKVIPLVMPKTLASVVLRRYEKYNTLLDRDYELSRTGQGFDTEYDALPAGNSKVKISRYNPLDLMEILEQQLDMGVASEQEATNGSQNGKATGKTKVALPVDTDDDDDDDDEDDEDDESVAVVAPRVSPETSDDADDDDDGDGDETEDFSREQLAKMGLRELKALAASNNVSVPKGADKDTIIAALLSEEDDEDDDDDDEADLSEEDLRGMSVAQLKALCKENGIKLKTSDKDQLVNALLDLQGEDDEDEEKIPF